MKRKFAVLDPMKSHRSTGMSRLGLLTLLSILLVWVGVAGAAVSKDAGVVLINQAEAIAGGITSCDTAGFPVTICTSGSYRLSGDLNVPSGTDGIEITASNVSLDLNGFTIVLPASGSTPSICSIKSIGSLSLIRIQNGILSGGDCGVNLAAVPNRVPVPCVSCPLSAIGIHASGNAVIRRNSVAQAEFGIDVQCPAVVVENVLANPFPNGSPVSGFIILPDPFGGNSALYRSSCTFSLNNQCTFSGSTPDAN